MIASVVGMWILSLFLHQIHWLNAFWIFAGFGIFNVILWLIAPLNEEALKIEKNKKISAQLKDLAKLFNSPYA